MNINLFDHISTLISKRSWYWTG